MKNIMLLFVSFLLLNRQETNFNSGNYLVIDYIGQHFVKSLLIYTEESELEIIKQGLTKRYDSMKQITPVERFLIKEEKMHLVNSDFDFEITSKKTYKEIISFIQTHDHLFASGIKYEGYEITVNDKTYYISYKSKAEFFEELKEYLTIKNCDKNVIERINVISHGP